MFKMHSGAEGDEERSQRGDGGDEGGSQQGDGGAQGAQRLPPPPASSGGRLVSLFHPNCRNDLSLRAKNFSSCQILKTSITTVVNLKLNKNLPKFGQMEG